MADDSRKKKEDLDTAKAAPKPADAVSAMPDGSDKSAYVPAWKPPKPADKEIGAIPSQHQDNPADRNQKRGRERNLP